MNIHVKYPLEELKSIELLLTLSAPGTVLRRQNLTSVGVRFWSFKDGPRTEIVAVDP